METAGGVDMSEHPSFDFAQELMAAAPALHLYARSLTRKPDAAEDLLQDTLLRAWAGRRHFTPGTSFRAWVFTIMRHRFLDICRRNRSVDLDLEGQADHPSLSTPAHQELGVELREMAQAFWRLSGDHREVLLLVGVIGLSYDAAAAVLGCRLGTVRSRLSRARDQLQAQIEHFGEPVPDEERTKENGDDCLARLLSDRDALLDRSERYARSHRLAGATRTNVD
ncbi:hypothetical protein FRZ61_26310 [Hypericibacter adhaerens]|uniref:RNA polymerase sigma factor n=1 Tax=Hypericibacter adhaerens TaxID=2602016 RepID=A0A5J6MYN3_9PROT|nr:sigma-70 family RNA polymerase sigma factor [Hypericibacter adhaerens]QEX22699.1 hypothetical protein FRZ61_26310 [Hypericibacter adhaerens]